MPTPPARPGDNVEVSTVDRDPARLAAALATLHRSDTARDGPTLIDFAESPRDDDWTLRSALVRLAQPEPVRAGAVLELIRRTDAALAPHRRLLESDPVPTAPWLSPDAPDPGDASRSPVWDARSTDLARVSARFPGGDAVVAAYADAEGLDEPERSLVPLLGAAVDLDELAEELTAWARDRTGPPPVRALDAIAERVFERLAGLGVPRESGPTRRRR